MPIMFPFSEGHFSVCVGDPMLTSDIAKILYISGGQPLLQELAFEKNLPFMCSGILNFLLFFELVSIGVRTDKNSGFWSVKSPTFLKGKVRPVRLGFISLNIYLWLGIFCSCFSFDPFSICIKD